jgi:phage terminase large subunit-like protein
VSYVRFYEALVSNALGAPTAADARDVMVEDESGILAVSPERGGSRADRSGLAANLDRVDGTIGLRRRPVAILHGLR